jgi:succinylglutamate-semialdehyde dehydrogenase
MARSGGHPGAYVDGHFVRPGRVAGELVSVDPGRPDAVVGRFPLCPDAVEAAVAAARAALPAWRAAPAAARHAVLRRYARLVAADAEPLARLVTREMGKPLWEAREEVALLVRKVEVTLRAGLRRVAPFRARGGGRCRFRPHGVLAVLGPFNMPLHLPNGHVVPALATGNTVVFKPSEVTPAAALRYARLFHRAGCPPGVFNLVLGGGDTGARLAAHPDVDGVLFTGSAAVGERLLATAGRTPGRLLALEMGGKNAAVVLADAEPRLAVRECLLGAFVTTGQRCTSTSRIIVARAVAPAFLDAFVAGARRLAVGYGLDPGVFMGPLATAAGVAKLARARRTAAAEGDEVLLPGGPVRRAGFYVTPSVHLVRTVRPRSAYQTEEIFGPDVAVYVVDEIEEAAALAEANPYGLALSVFTRRARNVEPFFARCRVGVLNWNRATVGASAALPFGGCKRSGNHRPAALFAADACAHPVATLGGSRGRAAPPPPGFPPP